MDFLNLLGQSFSSARPPENQYQAPDMGPMGGGEQQFSLQDALLSALMNQESQNLGQVPATENEVGAMQDNGTITVTGGTPRGNEPKVFEAPPGPRIFRPQPKPEGAEFGYELGANRSSPMGVKGKARDILGGIGDAFLVSRGMAPAYEQKRMQEKMQDAMEIYRQNPEEGLRAINSLDPKVAYDMMQDAEGNSLKRAELQRKTDSDQIRIMADGMKAWSMIGQTANAIKDQASYDQMKPILMNFASKYGIPLELPAKYDPAQINALVSAQMGRWREKRLFQMGQNLDSLMDYREGMLGQGERRLQQGQDRVEIAEREVTRKEKKDAAEDDGLGGRPAAAADGQYDQIKNGYGLIKGKSGELRSHWVKLN